TMEEIRSAMEQQMDLMADLVQKLSGELRTGLQPAYDNFLGFFHAIDWKEPWIMGLVAFHALLLLVTLLSRRHLNFHMFLFLLALGGVYFAENLNRLLKKNWRSFSTQDYFDQPGVFVSTLWSGPLLVIAMIILINTLFSLCYLIVKWKRAELRHRARLARSKQESSIFALFNGLLLFKNQKEIGERKSRRVKKEKRMEEGQRVLGKTIPVFTVLKNGAILKNIFVVNSRDFSSPDRNGNAVCDDGEVEEILLVGRHPDCDILLTHPSISRYHLQIRSLPSRQKLFVTDLSSVHGTWVTDQKVEPDVCVEVKEGDVIRIGGSTRIYRLHWIPLSRAYDIDNPFVPPLDASLAMEQDEENRMLEAEENLDVANQLLAKSALVDDGDVHLDVTSEGSGSSVPSEDEDTYITTRENSLPLASPSVFTVARDSVETDKLQFNEDLQTLTKWDLYVDEAAAEKPSSCYAQSKQQSDGLDGSEIEVSAEADEWDVRGNEVLHLSVMSERMESSVLNEDEDPYLASNESSSLPLQRESIETEKLQLTGDVQASPELGINIVEAKAENSGCTPSKGHIDGCFEGSDCTAFELAAEDEILSLYREVCGETEIVTQRLMEASPEPVTKAEFRSHVDNGEIEVAGQHIAVSPNSCPQAEQLLENFNEDARDLFGSEFQSEVSLETDGENLHQKINEVNPRMNREAEKVFEERSNSSENRKTTTETAVGSDRSGDSYKLSEIGSEGVTDTEVSFSSTLAAETCEDTKLIEELLSYCTESQENQTQQPHAVSDNALSEMEKAASVPLLEASGCSAFELAAEVEILSLHQEVSEEIGFVTENVMEASDEPLAKVDIETHKNDGETEVLGQVSPCSFPQTEPTLTGDARGLLGSEVAIETVSENLHQNSDEETISPRQDSEVSDYSFAGNERLLGINTEDIQSLCSSWQLLSESEVDAPFEISTEARDENQNSGMYKQAEKVFDEGSSSYLSEDFDHCGTQSFLLTPTQKPRTELSIDSGRSGESYRQGEIEGEENTDKGSPMAAETFEDTEQIEELPSDYTEGQENQTPETQSVRNDVLSELDSSISSSRRLSTCNIWSRRGKAASVLQVRTNSSKGKQKSIGSQPKDQLQRKQALSAEKLVPEIFTPDKENLTPSSHMLKRLQDIGDIEDSKSSLKLSGKPCSSRMPSSIAVFTSGAFAEPEIFTPDKENLTPNSHMLKRLREVGEIKDTKGSSSKATRKPFFDIHMEENVMEEQKQDLHSMSRKSKLKHDEAVAPKKKAVRAPFQPQLEKASSQTYTEATTASARNNISRGIRSSSNLSDGKNKMKWTIVLDTSSLLDKDSRKPLHLLQGLKGTHMVVPRTVLRELNETKRTRSLFFRRTTEIASSALDWIEECKVNTKWWIQLQSPSEETKANAPTPPVTPQSNVSAAFPFSVHWNHNAPEIDSPTSQDQVLECALLYRNRNIDEKLVLLSNDVTLKIKAMAEGVICETPHEFYESLKNPFSERFMWTESLPRGRTWSRLDDVVLRERYENDQTYSPYRKKKSMFNGGRGESVAAAKGLKLILLHNSHYGHIH
ncbi:unnamed protein product, partial [Thlaspi arvense]